MEYDQGLTRCDINKIIFQKFLDYNSVLKNNLYVSATVDNMINFTSIRAIMNIYHDELRDVNKKIIQLPHDSNKLLERRVVHNSDRISNTHSLNDISTGNGNGNCNINLYEDRDNYQNNEYNDMGCSEDMIVEDHLEIASKTYGNETLFQKYSGTEIVEKNIHVCKEVILLLLGNKALIISEGLVVINNQLEINLESNTAIEFAYHQGN
jgi:hypothetical protein